MCFCADTAPDTSIFKKLSDEECDWSCRGDENDKCGGSWKNSVYRTGISRKFKETHF